MTKREALIFNRLRAQSSSRVVVKKPEEINPPAIFMPIKNLKIFSKISHFSIDNAPC
jgi:hypothetical protein